MIDNQLSDEEKKRVSDLLYLGIEDMCEKYIEHVQATGGFNRFNIKAVLLEAAWHGYKTATKNNN